MAYPPANLVDVVTGDTVQATTINALDAGVQDIVTELGANPSGAAATVQARLDAFDTSITAAVIPVQEEGATVTADPSAINFVGAGVTATNVGTVATVTIPGGGSGGSALLAVTSYNPATTVNTATVTATYADADATNLAVTFTAPASGAVLVKLSSYANVGPTTELGWGLRLGASDVAASKQKVAYDAHNSRPHFSVRIAGLTPGASVTYKWSLARTFGTDLAQMQYGGDAGQAVMEVWSAP